MCDPQTCCKRVFVQSALMFVSQAGHTVRQLLHVAKKTVPPVEWKRTPVLFRATAGLRLLPPAKALALLEEVQRNPRCCSHAGQNTPAYLLQ